MKFNKYFLSGFVSFVVATGVMYTFFSMAAGGPAFGFFMSPSSQTVSAGQDFNVSVYATHGPNSIQSIAALIHYDKDKLRLKAANQVGVDPSFSVTSRCTFLDGCQSEGNIIFLASMTGNAEINLPDAILVGNLTFTALKSGTSDVTFDIDPKKSGFTSTVTSQSVLDTREQWNSTFTITSSGTTPPPPSPSLAPTPSPSTGSTTPKSSSPATSSKKSNTPSQPSSNGPTSTPSDSTSSTPVEGQAVSDSDNEDEIEITPVGNGGSGGGLQLFNPTVLAASAGLAALLVGLGFLAFSPPVRHAFADIRTLFNPPSAQLVGGGGTSKVGSTSPTSASPNSVVPQPTNTPNPVPDNPDAVVHSPGDIIYPPGTNKPPDTKV